jgi:ankyrin repeat protein
VNLESQDNNLRTPLSWAAQYHPVFINIPDSTPTIKLLLDHYDADPNSKCRNGRTPLSYAAQYGREETVRLLLERDIDVECKDVTGKTAFSYAVDAGSSIHYIGNDTSQEQYDRIMKLLLDRGAIDTRSLVT